MHVSRGTPHTDVHGTPCTAHTLFMEETPTHAMLPKPSPEGQGMHQKSLGLAVRRLDPLPNPLGFLGNF